MKFRVSKPVVSEWVNFEGEPDTAIQDHHLNAREGHMGGDGTTYRVYERNGDHRELLSLRQYEFEDGSTAVSKIYHSGIWRKGGVVNKNAERKHIEAVCAELNLTCEELFEEWEGVEKEWRNR